MVTVRPILFKTREGDEVVLNLAYAYVFAPFHCWPFGGSVSEEPSLCRMPWQVDRVDTNDEGVDRFMTRTVAQGVLGVTVDGWKARLGVTTWVECLEVGREVNGIRHA